MLMRRDYFIMLALFVFNMCFDAMIDITAHKSIQWLPNIGMSLSSIFVFLLLTIWLRK